MGLRDDILGFKPPDRFRPIEAFGKNLSVRVLHGWERDLYESSRQVINFEAEGRRPKMDARMNLHNIRARLVVLALGDEDGNRVFDGTTLDRHGNLVFNEPEVRAVGELDGRELDKVFEAASRLNGLNREALEDAEKNSGPARNGCSGSASPGTSA